MVSTRYSLPGGQPLDSPACPSTSLGKANLPNQRPALAQPACLPPPAGRAGIDPDRRLSPRPKGWSLDAVERVKKGNDAKVKIGDRFKDKTTGKIYILKMEIGDGTVFLKGENGLGRRLTGKASLKITCEKLKDITS